MVDSDIIIIIIKHEPALAIRGRLLNLNVTEEQYKARRNPKTHHQHNTSSIISEGK